MRNKHFTDALTYHAEKLIEQSVSRPLLFIEDDIHSFNIYRPLETDIEKKIIPQNIQDLISTLLEIMIVNREAYFAQFKNSDDLLKLYDMGYEKPDTTTFLIFNNDYQLTSNKTKGRFILQQELKKGGVDLN